MATFSEILPLFGADVARSFMMVPVGGFNMIYHWFGKGASFSVRPGPLSIRDITDEIRKAPDVSKIFKSPKQPLFVDKDEMTAFLHAALQGLSTDPSQRLLAVSADARGVHTVKPTGSRQSGSLTVWALIERPPTTISFRYVRYTGTWPPPGAKTQEDLNRYSLGVKRKRDEGEKYAKLVSQILRHQANVSIEFKSSEYLDLPTPFGPVATNVWFKETLMPHRDKDAATTIFVVPSIQGAEGRSMIDNDPSGLMVSDKPVVVWAGDKGDPFQLVATHELIHTLGSHHRNVDGLLMSDDRFKQSLLIDKDTLDEINPPSKR
jgi:hypothetical protein